MTDFIVVGQGLAGTALTWALLEHGATVAIVDRGDASSASRTAAGLITPASGRRFAVAPAFDDLRARACEHYRRVEALCGLSCFVARPALRFCQSQDEVDMLNSRRSRLGHHATVMTKPPASGLNRGLAGIEMPYAARLDVVSYLDSSRREFERRGMFHVADVAATDIAVRQDHVAVDSPSLHARGLVFCGGVADAGNAWLPAASFNPAKGEVLTVRIDGLEESRTVHAADCWLVPTCASGVYRFGATYDHADLQPTTTMAARENLMARLASLVSLPFDLLDQQAAIRPVGVGRQPIVGRHERRPRIAWLNGLGSKGALWAPTLAQQLAESLLGNDANDPQAAS